MESTRQLVIKMRVSNFHIFKQTNKIFTCGFRFSLIWPYVVLDVYLDPYCKPTYCEKEEQVNHLLEAFFQFHAI